MKSRGLKKHAVSWEPETLPYGAGDRKALGFPSREASFHPRKGHIPVLVQSTTVYRRRTIRRSMCAGFAVNDCSTLNRGFPAHGRRLPILKLPESASHSEAWEPPIGVPLRSCRRRSFETHSGARIGQTCVRIARTCRPTTISLSRGTSRNFSPTGIGRPDERG